MGTTLTGTTPQDTYDSLIKVTDNGPLSGTLKALSDGLGNDSTLSLSTTAASIAGTLAVSGNATFDTNTLFVDATNNRVGVGITTPDSKVRIQNDNATVPSLTIRDGGTPTVDHIRVSSGTYGDAFFVTAVGNVGIGTSTPSQKLEVSNGAAQFNGGGVDGNVGEAVFFGNSAFSTVQKNRIRSSISAGTLGNLLHLETGNGTVGAYNDNQLVLRGDGNVGIGQAAPAVKLDVVGNIRSSTGILFGSDTAAANLLDDYEEGTWTMGVSFGGASVGATYVLNGGTYTKIGRQVTVNGFLVLTSKGSSTGVAAITGLPFAVGNTTGNYSAASLAYITRITFTDTLQGYPELAQTQITLIETTNAGVRSSLTDADFANDSELMVSFTYFV